MRQPIPINAPLGARTSSYLYPQMSVSELHQTVAVIILDNGDVVQAGWFPENDPNGKYAIELSFNGYEDEIELETKDPYEVIQVMENLAVRLSRSEVDLAQSTTCAPRQGVAV